MTQAAAPQHTDLLAPKPADERPPDLAPYVQALPDGRARLDMVVGNLHCPACMQKIERALMALPSVDHARVNLTTQRLSVIWDGARLDAGRLMATVTGLGYSAKPFDPALAAHLNDDEDKALLRALGVAGFAAANVMLISISVWAGLDEGMGEGMGAGTLAFFHWLSALIVLPAVVYAGQPFYRAAWQALRNGHLNMEVPISLAVLAATAHSLYQTLAGGEQVYFDAAAMLLFFLLIGRTLDRRARTRARSAAHNLLALRTLSATVKSADGRQHILPIDRIEPGMLVMVAPGERIPVDGHVTEGCSEIDVSMMTGESLPETVKPGSAVFAGTLNLGTALTIRTTVRTEDTLLSEIVRLMEAAEHARTRYARLADRAARLYAPAVHSLAALTFLGWLGLSSVGWQEALVNAIAVLIITCPCALGLAVPAVQVVAVGRLLKRGILVKSTAALERLAAVTAVVFDKTGTLTRGEPKLVNRASIEEEDLRLAAALAGRSRHPLSQALCRAAKSLPPWPAALTVREHPGCGLTAPTPAGDIRLGRQGWASPQSDAASAPSSPDAAGPELWLHRPGRPAVRFAFEDDLRPGAQNLIRTLQGQGVFTALLSGDRASVVAHLAQSLGLASWQAELKPQHKITAVQELKQHGHTVLMVGDGLNDAPALAAADVSLSPASASDLAQASADFVFLGEALTPVAELIDVARQARRLILQNFSLALAYNAVAIPLAMAGRITPLIAAAAMSASSLVVTLNALRLHLRRKEAGA